MLHVVVFPSFFVRKDLVGLVDSFELFLKALIEIRMVLFGESLIGTFDFFLGSFGANFENLIVVYKPL